MTVFENGHVQVQALADVDTDVKYRTKTREIIWKSDTDSRVVGIRR